MKLKINILLLTLFFVGFFRPDVENCLKPKTTSVFFEKINFVSHKGIPLSENQEPVHHKVCHLGHSCFAILPLIENFNIYWQKIKYEIESWRAPPNPYLSVLLRPPIF